MPIKIVSNEMSTAAEISRVMKDLEKRYDGKKVEAWGTQNDSITAEMLSIIKGKIR